MNSPNFEDSKNEFFSLKQIGNLDDYIVKFEELKAIIVRELLMPDEFFADCFIRSLKPQLKAYVQSFRPWNTWYAIECARKGALSMDVITELKEPSLVTKNNTQEVAHKLFDETPSAREVEVSLPNVVLDVMEVEGHLVRLNSDPKVGEKLGEQHEPIVMTEIYISGEQNACSFTNGGVECVSCWLPKDRVENDVIVLYRSPLEKFIDRSLETNKPDPNVQEKGSEQQRCVTMAWKSINHEQRTCSLTENVTNVDVLVFNGHNELGKRNGCSCFVPFDPGGVHLVVHLLVPNVHIFHNIKAAMTVCDKRKFGYFIHGWVSARVSEVIGNLTVTTTVFDRGKFGLFVAATMVFDPGKLSLQ